MATGGDVVATQEGIVVTRQGAGYVTTDDKDSVKRAVVFIDTHRTGKGEFRYGSGFIAKLPFHNEKMAECVLMTCNHIFPSLEVARNSSIYFDRSSAMNPGTEIKGNKLFGSKFKTDKKAHPNQKDYKRFDYTVVEVRTDVLETCWKGKSGVAKPLPLAKCAEMMEKEGLRVNHKLYMIHYPQREISIDRCENDERICNIEGPYIGHMATTSGGSSGSPILREYNDELIVVGLHRGDLHNKDKNYVYANVATLVPVILADIKDEPYADSKFPDLIKFADKARTFALKVEKLPPDSTPPGSNPEGAPSQPADDDSVPMYKWYQAALNALKGKLKLKVQLKRGLVDKLLIEQGGFMVDGEVDAVLSQQGNAAQMGEVISILLGKTNGDFKKFCGMLRDEDVNCGTWADQLEQKAEEFKTEMCHKSR